MSILKKQKMRTRFAPSPTGYLHIGGLRTALYAYLVARQNNGQFILRIEDTDQSRAVEGATENLIRSLKWAGLEPDEGVLLDSDEKVVEKGDLGPYIQTKRADLYKEYIQKLIDDDKAYYCFCTPERLTELRESQQAAKKQPKYDKKCCGLDKEEALKRIEAGEKYVVRMNVPENKKIKFKDLVRGTVEFNTNEVDDQVILKSDGLPTYHLASVVDDHLMEISLVIRGEEWLPSTPKHILLYEFLDWKVPEFAHLSLLLNPDKSKLSKRQGDVAVEDYIEKGYLPEALINFVALLGWNPGTEQEIFSIEELIKEFDFEKVHKPGAVFDTQKLDWMNGEYIKKMDFERFKSLAMPYLEKNVKKIGENVDAILNLEKERISHLDEIGKDVDFLFVDKLEYDEKMLVWKKSDLKSAKKNLQLLTEELEKYDEKDWTADKLQEKVIKWIADSGLKNGDVLWPMRVALTGKEKSPTPFEVAEILGKEQSLKRLKV